MPPTTQHRPGNPFAPPALGPVAKPKHKPGNPFVTGGEIDTFPDLYDPPKKKERRAPVTLAPFDRQGALKEKGLEFGRGVIDATINLASKTASGLVRYGTNPDNAVLAAGTMDRNDPQRKDALPKSELAERSAEDAVGNIQKVEKKLLSKVGTPPSTSTGNKIARGLGRATGQIAPFVVGAGAPGLVIGSAVNAVSEMGARPEESLLGMVSPEHAKSPTKRGLAALGVDIGMGGAVAGAVKAVKGVRGATRTAEALRSKALQDAEKGGYMARIAESLEAPALPSSKAPASVSRAGAVGNQPTAKPRAVKHEEIFTPEATTRFQSEAAEREQTGLRAGDDALRARIAKGEDLTDAEVHAAEPNNLSEFDYSDLPMPGKEGTTIGAEVKRLRIRQGNQAPIPPADEVQDPERVLGVLRRIRRTQGGTKGEYGDVGDVIQALEKDIARGRPITRGRLRAHIAKRTIEYGKRDAVKEGIELKANRTAVILTGPPAAGKTTISNQVGKFFGAYVIDSDVAKVRIPEYDLIGANGVHPESGIIMDNALRYAANRGENIIVPGLGRTEKSVTWAKEELEKRGYTVYLTLADLAGDQASIRAFNRGVERGRFLSPEFVAHVVGDNPRKVFEKLAESGTFGGRVLQLDQSKPLGTPLSQRVIRRGHTFPLPAIAGQRSRGERVAVATAAGAGPRGFNAGRAGAGRPRLGASVRGEPAPAGGGVGRLPGEDFPALPGGRGLETGTSRPESGLNADVPHGTSKLRGAVGDEDDTFFGGKPVRVRYRVVEAGDLIPSNDAHTFERRADYPAAIQGRVYSGTAGKGAAEQVVSGAMNLDSRRVVNPNRNITGPPVVSPDGPVVAGNQRAMMMQRVYDLHPEKAAELRAQILADAKRAGINPADLEGIERPVMVREIIDPSINIRDENVLRELNELSDRAGSKTKDPLTEAMGRARQLKANSRALEHYAATSSPDEPLSEYLQGPQGLPFLNRLVEDKVISPAELDAFRDAAAGRITKQGRQKLQDMMSAAAVGDASIIDAAPAAIVGKLEAATPRLVAAAQVDGWSLEGPLQEALQLHTSKVANGQKSIADALAQPDMLGREIAGEQGQVLARFLETNPKAKVSDAMRQWSEAAEKAAKSDGSADMFGVSAETADEAFERIFAGRRPAGRVGALGNQPPDLSPVAKVVRNENGSFSVVGIGAFEGKIFKQGDWEKSAQKLADKLNGNAARLNANAAKNRKGVIGSAAGDVSKDPYNYAALKMLTSMAGAGIGGGAGATAGSRKGATPQERMKNAAIVGGIGAIAGGVAPFAPEMIDEILELGSKLRTAGADKPARLFNLHATPEIIRVKVSGQPSKEQMLELFEAVRKNPKATFRYSVRDLEGREVGAGRNLGDFGAEVVWADSNRPLRTGALGDYSAPEGAIGNQPGERVGDAAFRADDGKVYYGRWHGEALTKAVDAGAFPKGSTKWDDSRMGFATDRREFVSREEAYKIADDADQIEPLDPREASDATGIFANLPNRLSAQDLRPGREAALASRRRGAAGNQPDMFGAPEGPAQGGLFGDEAGKVQAPRGGGFAKKQAEAKERYEFLLRQIKRMPEGPVRKKVAAEAAELARVANFDQAITKDEVRVRSVAGEDFFGERTGAVGNQPRPGNPFRTRTERSPYKEPDYVYWPKNSRAAKEAASGYLNMARTGLDKTGQARIDALVASGLDKGTIDKGYRSMAEFELKTEEQKRTLLKKLVEDPNTLVGPAKLKNVSSATIKAMWMIAGDNTKVIEAAARVMTNPLASADEILEATKLHDRAYKQTEELLSSIVTETAQKGRELGALRNIAKQSTDPEVWLVQAKRVLGDRPMSDAVQANIRKLARRAQEACRG